MASLTEEDVPSLLLQRVARIRPLQDLDAKFALLVLGGKQFSDYLKPIFTGISVPHVSPEQICGFRLALPSLEEQVATVEWVTAATEDISTATAFTQHEISLLREYLTRLIGDVVTGKLDVREAAARLPDEPEEPEPQDEAEGVAEDSGADLDVATEEAEA